MFVFSFFSALICIVPHVYVCVHPHLTMPDFSPLARMRAYTNNMSKGLEPFPLDTPPSAAPQRQTPHAHKHSSNRMWWILGVVLAIVVIGGGGTTALMLHHRAPKAAANTRTTTTNQPITTTPVNSALTTYTSNGTDLNLSFSYPSGWTVAPASNNNTSDQPVTIASPATTISTGTASATGKVVVMIRPGNSQIDELSSGNAMVAQSSVQFAYSKPTASQHQYPYLTFVHLAGGQNPTSAFDEIFITGISSFSANTPMTAGSLGQLDPIISARFYTCSTSDCTGSGVSPLTITNATWQNDPLCQQVQALFASLQLN